MIGVEGQYLFAFDVNGREDFLSSNDLIQADFLEYGVNMLPSLELNFKTTDDSILKDLNEKSKIVVRLGTDSSNLVPIPFMITSCTRAREGDTVNVIRVSALYDAASYLSTSRLLSTSKISGAELVKLIANKYFRVVRSNFDRSYDKQHWICPNYADKTFVNEVWSRIDLGKSVPLVGITIEGEFRIMDAVKLIRSEPKYRLTNSGSHESIVVSPGAIFVDRTSTNNYLNNGYKKLVELNLGSGSEEFSEYSPSKLLGRQLNVREDILRVTSPKPLDSNVHQKYNKAKVSNLSKITSLSNNSFTLMVSDKLIPFKVLDLVEYLEDEIHSSLSNGLSGRYIISTVGRTLLSNRLTTTLEISRDSQMNY